MRTKTFGSTFKKRPLLLIEVLATMALFSLLLVFLSTHFVQMQTTRRDLIKQLTDLESAQTIVFEEKRKLYANPETYIETDSVEKSVPNFPKASVKIQKSVPKNKERAKTYLVRIESKVGKARFIERVLVTKSLTK